MTTSSADAQMAELVGPLEPAVDEYHLQITGDRIDAEREVISETLLDVKSFGLNMVGLRSVFSRRSLTTAYRDVEPFIQRMLTVELDAKTPKGPGIGEALVGSPKPRFGAKFRRALSKSEARDALGHSFERLIIAGFMSALARGAYADPYNKYYSSETTKISAEKYRHWIKYFPAFGDQLFLRTRGLDGGPMSDPSAQMYLISSTSAVLAFEAHCMNFKVRGPLGLTKGGRDHFWYYGFSAGYVLAQLSAKSAFAAGPL